MNYLVAIIILLLAPFNLSGQSANKLLVPRANNNSSTIINDGIFNETNWERALKIQVSDSLELLVFQDDENLYVGLKNLASTRRTNTDLFISNKTISQVNLHASMQLGERGIKNGSWDISVNPWEWGNNKNWSANVISYDKSKASDLPMIYKFKDFEGQEFSISKNKIVEGSVNIRVEITEIDDTMKVSRIEYPFGVEKSNPSKWLRFGF